MRTKKLLAAFLLSVGLCFVPALGCGEIQHCSSELPATFMQMSLVWARIDYMMSNPNSFLKVTFYYIPKDDDAKYWGLPETVDMKGKIFLLIRDNRGIFSYKSGVALLDQFKEELGVIYSSAHPIKLVATDMHVDIVAKFLSKSAIPLGCFYQGEYHLWEK